MNKDIGIPYVENFDINYGLEGKTAIVTGAANGIGEAICRLFARKSANVMLVDKSDKTADALNAIGALCEGVGINRSDAVTSGAKGGRLSYIVGDITHKGFPDTIVKKTLEAFGAIDILVNCAGVALLDDAESLPEEYWDQTLDVNLKAAFMVSQAVGRHMIGNGGGKIINIASQASVVALDRHVAYCASKAGLVSVTQVLATEWAEYGINVNAISPTVVLTELGKKAWAGEAGEDMKKLIPARRFGYPDEIAACAAYLASDAANLITGANIVIDGGYTVK